jgi:hypothetical protein
LSTALLDRAKNYGAIAEYSSGFAAAQSLRNRPKTASKSRYKRLNPARTNKDTKNENKELLSRLNREVEGWIPDRFSPLDKVENKPVIIKPSSQ